MSHCAGPHPVGQHITGCVIQVGDLDSGQYLLSHKTDPWAGAREHMAIVRELAERGPFVSDDGWDCADCDVNERAVNLNDPAAHKPECLWRRARDLYPPS